jgi:type IV pilus assembly protein PilV
VLEALTAVAVFSIGVLATIALHARSLGHVDDARCRGEAERLAHTLIATMWATDPASLAARYGSDRNGDGYAEFVRLARRLRGADTPANAPEVRIADGPAAASRSVSIVVYWQAPGAAIRHRYAVTAAIGRN